jgi:hypothetical protein
MIRLANIPGRSDDVSEKGGTGNTGATKKSPSREVREGDLTCSFSGDNVNAIQKCHRLRKAEVSPRARAVAQPDRA